MKVAILGIDGYLGWSLTLKLLSRGHDVVGLDNFLRRRAVAEVGSQSVIPIANMSTRLKAVRETFGKEVAFEQGDVLNYRFLEKFLEKHKPDSIVNFAQQPSPHYSMMSPKHATFTQANNVCGGLNLLWAVRKINHEIPIITLGTLGEWSTPNMPIPEGFFRVKHEGMEDILPFPRQGHSIYHVSKIQTTDNVWFACRTWVMKVTDVHQGVVVGTRISEMPDDSRLRTRFDIDECFGTVVNRFAACAVSGQLIPVYGTGCQTRGYLSLRDSMQCLTLAIENPPTYDDSFHGHRVINQFSKTYSVNDLAQMVKKIAEKEFGLSVGIEHIENPRVEPEIHYYNPRCDKLRKMGFKEEYTIEETVEEMIGDILQHKDRIITENIRPRIRWRDKKIKKEVKKWI